MLEQGIRICEAVGRTGGVVSKVVSTALWVPERIITGALLIRQGRGGQPSESMAERLRTLRGLVRLAQGAEMRPHFELHGHHSKYNLENIRRNK